MEVVTSLGLIVLLLLALNHMAGGKPDRILRPVGRLANDVVGFGVRVFVRLFGAGARLLGGSLKSLPPPGAGSKDNKDGGASPKPPPRW